MIQPQLEAVMQQIMVGEARGKSCRSMTVGGPILACGGERQQTVTCDDH
jgi:hypothetical protein